MATLANYWAAKGKASGWEVTLLTMDDGKTAPFYPLHREVNHRPLAIAKEAGNLIEGIAGNCRRIRVLRTAITRSAPDVVISFMTSMNVTVLLAAAGLGIPVVVSERVDPGQHSIERRWKALRWLIYRMATQVVGQSERALRYFPKAIRKRSRVIPNPVAEGRAETDLPAPKERHDKKRVIAMGRLEKQKGFDLLIAAFSNLAPRHLSWDLVIWGDGGEREALEREVRNRGLCGRVCLPGTTRHPARELRGSDLFVLSSRYEGFPNVLCEAMAAGLPVISFDCPSGPREIIRDGVDGLLVPTADPGRLAIAMERLMDSKEERMRLAARAPDVAERFSVEKVMKHWERLLDEIVKKRGSRAIAQPPCSDTVANYE